MMNNDPMYVSPSAPPGSVPAGTYETKASPAYVEVYQPVINNIREKASEVGSLCDAVLTQLDKMKIKPGAKFEVGIIMDISYSMENPNKFFSDGKVQAMINTVLAIAGLLDKNQEVEIFPFGAKAVQPLTVKIGAHQNIAQYLYNEYLQKEADHVCGNTIYYTGIEAAIDHYEEEGNRKVPKLLFFVTDGANRRAEQEAFNQVSRASRGPYFIKFLGLKGQAIGQTFGLLKRLDSFRSNRSVDNSDHKVYQDPTQATIAELFEELDSWLYQAEKKGYVNNVLMAKPKKKKKRKRCTII